MKKYESDYDLYSTGKVQLSDGKLITILFDEYKHKNQIISYAKAKEIIEGLQELITSMSSEDIEQYNQQVRENQYKEVEEYQRTLAKESKKVKLRPSKHVYLFYSELLNKYKIGIAKNVEERAKGFPQDEVIVITHSSLRPDAYEQEQALHTKYKEYSCGNEWFIFPTNNIIEEVKSIISNL